jgi:GNAT superfamily N-acetyltransferase
MAEEKGLLKVYTARDNGIIAGYCVTIISQCYKTTKIKAHQEALYVKPDYRRFGVGGELLQYVDSHLKQIGVHVSSQSVPSNMNWDNLLIDKGYKKFRTIYEKEL